MLEEVENDRPAFAAVQSLVPRWRAELRGSGPGTIDLGLERVQGEAAFPREMALLLDRVWRGCARFEDPIPAAVLNAKYRVSGVRFGDYPHARLSKAIDKLRSLAGLAPG